MKWGKHNSSIPPKAGLRSRSLRLNLRGGLIPPFKIRGGQRGYDIPLLIAAIQGTASTVRLYKAAGGMVDFNMKYGAKAIEEAGLEMWDNPSPERNYEINITFPEFTCLCPRSGYPDFAVISINYVPSKKIVELKSLKLYLNSFRNSCVSHEEATNRIYSQLIKELKPKFLEVIGDFNPRGNVKTVIRVSSGDKKRNKRHLTAETRRGRD